MNGKNQLKANRTKTNFETDALNLAAYLYREFGRLCQKPADLEPKRIIFRIMQRYLDQNAQRIVENKLRCIMAVKDLSKHATGGRIHLIAALEGPIVEALQPGVLEQPIDYELKNKYLLRALKNASQNNPPAVGNIHIHPFWCNLETVTPLSLLDFLRAEHGYQNDLQQIATVKIFLFMPAPIMPYWKPNINTEMIQNMLGKHSQFVMPRR